MSEGMDVSAPALTKAQHQAHPDRLGLALVAAAYAAVTGFLAWRLPLWQDEMYTLHTTASGPIEAARKAISVELQPPVYFMADALWRTIRELRMAKVTAADLPRPAWTSRRKPLN